MLTPEGLKAQQVDEQIRVRYNLDPEQFFDYVERVGICVEAGVSEEEAIKIALKQVGVIK
jgi:hypothetical protein